VHANLPILVLVGSLRHRDFFISRVSSMCNSLNTVSLHRGATSLDDSLLASKQMIVINFKDFMATRLDQEYQKWSRIADQAGAHDGTKQSNTDKNWQLKANTEMKKILNVQSDLNRKKLNYETNMKNRESIHRSVFTFK